MATIETTKKIAVELPLVHSLIEEQFPKWSHLPIRKLGSTGTENSVCRLGKRALIRMPMTADAAMQVAKERRWLPYLAEQGDFPLAIPKIKKGGVPTDQYPYPWSIYDWLKGKPATRERLADINHAAKLLGQFVATLQDIAVPNDPPLPGEHNFFRGVPLAQRDDITQEAFRKLHASDVDVAAASNVWDDAVTAPIWDEPPVWIHGDLADSNLLARTRRLAAVIDFGGLGVGDPACDLLVGWDVVADEREVFFDQINPDDATIRRGRGWAVSTAVLSLVRFPDQPAIRECALHKLNQATQDMAA